MFQEIRRNLLLSPLMAMVLVLSGVSMAAAQAFHPGSSLGPGQQGSTNMKIISHIPMGGPFHANDLEIEQELSRPYVYLSRRATYGFSIIDIKEPTRAKVIYNWEIDNPDLHTGRALDNKYFKIDGRYYSAQSFQFRPGGPDADLGAVVFDVTGLPDTTTVKEVARIEAADTPGGFHNIFAYKHSNGDALLFATVGGPHGNVYDLKQLIAGDPNDGLVSRVPNPSGSGRGYHDFYVGYDLATRQDKFYGPGSGGFFVYDITDVREPTLITSATGIAGMSRGHTFTPTPDGRYAVLESEYQYAPLRIIDLKPALDGEVETISRPIGAWTSRWQGLPHNHEVRWPYVFVSSYEDGVHVFNMMDPTNPYTVGYYDTYDGPNEINKANPFEPKAAPGRGGVTNGSFGIDVRNADGLIVTGDMYTGFWALKMDGFDGWNGHQWGMPNISSVQDWDNGPEGAPRPQRAALR